jgi:phage gp29-like protein
MIKTIRTYQDMLDEKKRLEALLILQKQALRNDFEEIKENLKPVQSALSFAGKLVTRDNGNFILNAGANKLIDLVIRKFILSRAGWFAKLVVPFLAKNYSSHIISENKGAFLTKLFSWIGKKNANGKKEKEDADISDD